MNTATHTASDPALRTRVLQALAAFLLAAVCQALLTSGRFELPQRGGESVLTLVSDDTRMALSAVMLQKVDDYFHGGAKAAGCALDCDHEHDHEHDCDHGCDHDHGHDQRLPAAGRDPFRWINLRVHAQEHRHLKKSRSVEMLPWVTAAVKASPHNIQAYDTGAYILVKMTDTPRLAVDFLEEGIRHNPASAELETSLGEIYLSTLKDFDRAAVHFRSALAKSLNKNMPLSEDDRFLRLRISFYLGVIAREKRDAPALQSAFDMAFELWPQHVMTRTLAGWLDEAGSGKEPGE